MVLRRGIYFGCHSVQIARASNSSPKATSRCGLFGSKDASKDGASLREFLSVMRGHFSYLKTHYASERLYVERAIRERFPQSLNHWFPTPLRRLRTGGGDGGRADRVRRVVRHRLSARGNPVLKPARGAHRTTGLCSRQASAMRATLRRTGN